MITQMCYFQIGNNSKRIYISESYLYGPKWNVDFVKIPLLELQRKANVLSFYVLSVKTEFFVRLFYKGNC